MDLDAIDLFCETARRGSFAGAAKARDLDPSSVSRAIALLERELGVRLFQRSTRTMSLTEAGALYRARVEPLLEELAQAREAARSIQTGLTGTLRLTASVAMGLRRIGPLIPLVRARHPGLALECLFTDANLDLVAERIDLAVRLAPALTGDLVATRLAGTRYRIVAARSWLARYGALQGPGDLERVDCIRLDLSGFRSRWLVRRRDAPADVTEARVSGSLCFSTPLGIRDAAVAGLGPALLADWLIGEDLASGALVDLLPDHEATATTFDTAAWAVYPSRAFLPAKTRVMIDLLRAAFAADGPGGAGRPDGEAAGSPP